MEALFKRIFFKAVLSSLHWTSSPSQVLCDKCENGETVIDIEDHKCYYQTMQHVNMLILILIMFKLIFIMYCDMFFYIMSVYWGILFVYNL